MLTSLPVHVLQPPISLEVYIGHQLMQGDLLIHLCQKHGNRVVILTDPSVRRLYGDELSRKLSAVVMEIPTGEKAKTREVKQMIEDQLLRGGYGRETVLIGLGGGSTTDLAGFVASTYFRGLPLILVPTSLLGMVDASIGGKTGIDTNLGKNLIGTFYHPKAIVSDLEVLTTLPEHEKRNGFAEIIKMGLIFDVEIIALIENDLHSLEELVIKAAKAKIAVIAQDPFDRGMRRILNFGHTIGHALESMSNYSISHGEAVAIGCVIESYLSAQLGYLPEEQFFQIEKLYQTRFGSMQLPTMYQRDFFLQFLTFDKKKSIEGIRFVLIQQIGQAISFNGEYCRTVPQGDLESALLYMERYCA